MENVEVRIIEKPKLKSPIMVEGLPGVGNVGKLAAEHLLDEVKAIKFADIISKHLPPQIFVNDDGTIKQASQELYYYRMKEEENDLIILVGDYQGITPEGQYELTDSVLAIAKKYDVKRIYALGGYGVGKMITKPRVLGACTSLKLVKEIEKFGVVFQRGEPGSGIVGAAGLLLGLGDLLYNIEGVCLMGETTGYFVDPKSAQAVLGILTKILNIKISMAGLESKANQIETIAAQLKDLEKSVQEERKDDLRYIG